MSAIPLHRFLFAAAMALVIVGCGSGNQGPAHHRVSGTVTFEGNPVPNGNILFTPDDSKGTTGPAAYAKIVDGKYDTQAEGAKSPFAGEFLVEVEGVAAKAPNEEIAKKLFPTYKTTLTMPSQDFVFDIVVPSSKK